MQTKSGSVRTTLAIDNDVMTSARWRADVMGESLGAAISAMARAGIATTNEPYFRNGIKLLSVNPGATGATMEEVNRLLDELE
ncbi:MAG: CopG family transcriptional regulator [Thermomicrobiales bacterium]